jgi:hypothetical protein
MSSTLKTVAREDFGARRSTLQASALALAARGFRVFPVIPGTKRPAIERWQELATTDPDKISQAWASREYNIGVACGGGILGLDVDVKNGKPGMTSLLALDLSFDALNTFTVRTCSGGLHFYYRITIDLANSAGRLGDGLDVRGAGGFLVGPGSVIDGKLYEIENDSTLAECPPEILSCARAPLPRGDRLPVVELDQEAAIRRGVDFLESAPLAIQDSRGDETTLRVAYRLKDLGLSEPTVLELMLLHWNERCSPPWSVENLGLKVHNAYRYGRLPPGANHPEAEFRSVKTDAFATAKTADWPDPKPLPPRLPEVAAFNASMLPENFRDWVVDVSERMQCPPDYVAVSAIVAAGALIGRKLAIRPQGQTDYAEIPNLWGMIIGRPGVLKTPAMAAALAPLRRLDAKARQQNAVALALYDAELERFKITKDARNARLRDQIKKGLEDDSPNLEGIFPPEAPPRRRYIVDDFTYEILGVILSENPNGVLAFRDELISLLKPLSRDENAPARGFLLSGWNGKDAYSFDRIGRGNIQIGACCLSLLGATQPGRLGGYLRDAVSGGEGDDGFAQRFGLLVWPDINDAWRNIDRVPNADAARAARAVFDRLDVLSPFEIGAQSDPPDPVPFLRFDDEARAAYEQWREALERRKRSGELHVALEAHIAKYHGLAAKLALIFHVIDGRRGPVGGRALALALEWMAYLETHAVRAYASVAVAETTNARAIVRKLKSGDLSSPFTAREIHQSGWAGLGDREAVRAALSLLLDYDWLDVVNAKTGGRSKTLYRFNPKALSL